MQLLLSRSIVVMSEEEEEEEPPAGLRAGEVAIQEVIQVQVGGKRKRWYPTTTNIDGVRYVKLEKWDRALIYLVTGNALQLHKKLD